MESSDFVFHSLRILETLITIPLLPRLIFLPTVFTHELIAVTAFPYGMSTDGFVTIDTVQEMILKGFLAFRIPTRPFFTILTEPGASGTREFLAFLAFRIFRGAIRANDQIAEIAKWMHLLALIANVSVFGAAPARRIGCTFLVEIQATSFAGNEFSAVDAYRFGTGGARRKRAGENSISRALLGFTEIAHGS